MNAQKSIGRIKWWAAQMIRNCQILLSFSSPNKTSPTPVPRRNRVSSVVIKWIQPTPSWVQLNVDGSTRGNPGISGGGGICRKDDGSFLFAFSEGYGYGTNNRAEFRAIHDGLEFCLQIRMNRIIIESDSKLAMDILAGKAICPWN
jgi:hypothetical protein